MKRIVYSLCFIFAAVLAFSAPIIAHAPPLPQPITIGTPVTSPAAPSSSDPVTVSVNVTQQHPGIMNVSIVYTIDGWRSVNATVPATYNSTLQTWVATIPAQAGGGHVQFYILAYDYNDNRRVGDNSGAYFSYDVPGSPLSAVTSNWIILAAVLGGIGAFAVVLLRSMKRHPSRTSRTNQ